MSQITLPELEATSIEILPDRETLGLISFNKARIRATNVSVAANVLTAFSNANSNASQVIWVSQH